MLVEGSQGSARRAPGKGREVLGILLVAAAAFAWVSLHVSGTGLIGEEVAAALLRAFGRGRDLPPALVLILGLLLMRGRAAAVEWRRALALGLLSLETLVVLHLTAVPPAGPGPGGPANGVLGSQVNPVNGGGAIGAALAELAVVSLGRTGTLLLVGAVALISLSLVVDRPLLALAGGFGRGALAAARWVLRGLLWRGVRGLGALVRFFAHGVGSALDRVRVARAKKQAARSMLPPVAGSRFPPEGPGLVAGAKAGRAGVAARLKGKALGGPDGEDLEETQLPAGGRPAFRQPRDSSNGAIFASGPGTGGPERRGCGTGGAEAAGVGAGSERPGRAISALGAVLGSEGPSGRRERPRSDCSGEEPGKPGDVQDLGPEPATRNRAGETAERAPAPGPGRDGSGRSFLEGLGGRVGAYQLPPPSLFRRPAAARRRREEPDQSAVLEETLQSFGIQGKVTSRVHGPVVTRYEFQPAPGIKVSRITSLQDDLALALAAADVRIEAPVPGKSVVGIEVPNKQVETVYLREVIESPAFSEAGGGLALALGKDIAGQPVVADLTRLIHLLIAGATGSGKSVCLGSIISSLLLVATPDRLKLLMIDPKRVELTVYDGVPHLIVPVVTDPRQAALALRWAVKEMEERYERFAHWGVRNIDGFNRAVEQAKAGGRRPPRPAPGAGSGEEEAGAGFDDLEPMPYLVIVVDELADLMLVAAAEVEDSICRLAQMARAAGIHLVVATQRPSVDVVTGLIKANIPSRLAFAVSSQVDSRTILDMAGAERLLGRGDMLFHPIGAAKPIRAQGCLVTDREIEQLVEFWKAQGEPEYRMEILEEKSQAALLDDEDDPLLEEAIDLVLDAGQASVSMLQRRFRVGYARAARLVDMMERRGIVGPYQGSKPREVIAPRREPRETAM